MIKNPSTFNDVESVKLRAYNRAVMAMNLAEENGDADTRAYFQTFSDAERGQIFAMLLAIKQDPEETKRQVILDANTI